MQVIVRKNARPGVSAIRSQSRVSRDPKRGKRVEVGFLITDKIHRLNRDKLEPFSSSGSKSSGVPLKNPEQVRGEEGAGDTRKQPETTRDKK